MESSPTPAAPVAPYLGGKRNLAKHIIARIESVPHEFYCEPFVGMGGIFLRRRRAAKAEVINDFSRDVATFFRVLQNHYVAFIEQMRWLISSRAEFERLLAQDPDTLTDLQRSARFLYIQRQAYGGKVSGRTYGVDPARPARFDITRLEPTLADLHDRLAGVAIECLPFGDFIGRYDRPGTLFYCDPPYWGCERDYGDIFGRDDFQRLADQLATLKGRFILSLNDVDEIREIFAAFHIEAVETTYTVAKGKSRRAGELIISGGAVE